MIMTGQKLQLQLLQGRSGGAVEPVRVEDDRVENENQDDGAGPEKEMGEVGCVWGMRQHGGRRGRGRGFGGQRVGSGRGGGEEEEE